MNNDITFPAWVNTPGYVYQAEKEETAERLATPEDVPNPVYAPLMAVDETTIMEERSLQEMIEEDTRIMRRRDWVDRWQDEKARAEATGEPLRINWGFVTVGLVYSALVLAVVWLVGSWVGFYFG